MVCVPLFFFLGGYGLYKRIQSRTFRLWDALVRLYTRYWKVFVIFVPLAFLFFARADGTFGARFVITSPKQFFIDLLGNFFGYKATFNSEWWFFGAYLCAVPLGCLFCRAIRRHRSFLGDMFLVFVIDILTQNVFPALAAAPALSGLNYNLYFSRLFLLHKYTPVFFAGIVCARYNVLAMIKQKLEPVPCKGLVALAGAAAVILCRTYATADKSTADILYAPFLTVFLSVALGSLAPLRSGFVFLGRHSTNMWLIHTFYCYYFLPFARLVYCTRFAWFDLAVLTALSLGTSMLLELLYKYLGMLWRQLRRTETTAAN